MLDEAEICSLTSSRAQAYPRERGLVVEALYKRNLVREIAEEDIFRVRGRKVTAGAFGVAKPGKVTEEGEDILRLIINLTPANLCQKSIAGDVDKMAGATSWLNLVLVEGEVLLISGDDIVCSFYLFELPASWSPFFAFGRPVPRRVLHGAGEDPVWVSMNVLPMGWLSAVGLMQHAHRNIMLWPGPAGGNLSPEAETRRDRPQPLSQSEARAASWHVYVDDFTELERVRIGGSEHAQRGPGVFQSRARAAYSRAGWPWAAEKAVEREVQGERLGRFLDGDVGRLGVRSARLLANVSLGLYLIAAVSVPRHSLQIFAGREVHTLEMRRCLFSWYNHLWRRIGSGPGGGPLGDKLAAEILGSLSPAPMRFTSLRANLHPWCRHRMRPSIALA